MKKILSILFFVFVSVILFGCETQDNNKAKENKKSNQQVVLEMNQPLSENETLKIDGEIMKIKFSTIKGGQEKIFDDDESIKTFTNILSSAIKLDGSVNMANPEYKMEVTTNKGSQRYYLWIGNKGEKSSLMKTNETHIIYTVSEEMTEKLIELVK